MSSAVLAGMRLKLLWLWFTSASYAQTFSLFYKHSGEFFPKSLCKFQCDSPPAKKKSYFL